MRERAKSWFLEEGEGRGDGELYVREALIRTFEEIMDSSGVDEYSGEKIYVLHLFADNYTQLVEEVEKLRSQKK